MKGRRVFPFLAVGAIIFLSAGPVAASGFGIFLQGASALGQADAVVAHDERPSSIFFNPALISRLPGTQVETGSTLVVPRQEFRGDGESAEGEDDFFLPSTFYATHSLGDRLTAGLGIFNPFGLGTDWPDDWPGRYLATESEITTYTINPVLAWRAAPWLSLAAGVDLLLLDARLENKINSALLLGLPSGTADSGRKLEGDGNGLGYNLGVLIDLSDRLSLGASYRSEIEVDIDGEISFDRASPLLTAALPETGAETTITLPQQVTAGLAWEACDRLTLEAGVRWEDWSSFDDLTIRFDQPVLGETVIVQPRNWDDTFSYNVGARYRLTDQLFFNAGYLYGEDPIPDATFEPGIPDSPVHTFSAGTEVRFDRWWVAFAYNYLRQEDREKKNAVGDPIASSLAGVTTGTANGTYQKELHLVGISVGGRF